MSVKAPVPYSLRRRLLIWLLVPLLVIGLIALFDAYRAARQISDEISDRVMAGSALAIAERIFVNDEGMLDVDIPYVALEMLTSAEDDRVFYKIEDSEGAFITGYNNLDIPLKFERNENGIEFTNSVFRGFPIRIAVLKNAASSSSVSLGYQLVIAETTNARTTMAREILIRSAIRQGLLILTAAIVVWFAVTRALLPLYKIRDAIGRRSTDDLRPIKHHVPTEIGGLVTTTNDLLSRIASSLASLRNFTTNVSHQIRTPLAVIHTQLELVKRAQNNDVRLKAIDSVDDAVKDAEKVVSKLLVLARIDSAAIENLQQLQCDIAQLCKGICADFIANPNYPDVDIGYEGDAHILVLGDEILLREMLKNLVENAIKYGGRNVLITLRCFVQDQRCVVEVEDNGVGVSHLQKAELMKRFFRGSHTTDGLGVGLPLARDIAELFGAELKLLDAKQTSGLRVVISFPS